MKLLLLLVSAGAVALAQDNHHTAANGNPPAAPISTEQRASFWRAAAELNAIKPTFDRAQANLQKIVADLRKACGEMTFDTDPQTGEPTCIKPKPEAQKLLPMGPQK